MAGAGYKLFNTGDVLTAAQVNTYLQEQVVMVFASATARTTALSGVLAEGMMSYLQDTNAVEVYNGSAWVSVSGASSPLTTKGDLYTYSTTDARLGVGTNNQQLLADSAQATGLKWAASPTSTLTTTGDLLYASSANTLARLGIGTTGQVLTVSGGVPSWAAAASGGGYTLLETLTLSGTSTTSSTISGSYKHIFVDVKQVYFTANDNFSIRLNGDNGTTAYVAHSLNIDNTTISANNESTNCFFLCDLGNNSTVTQNGFGTIFIPRYTDTANVVEIQTTFSGYIAGQRRSKIGWGFYDNTAAITSITFRAGSANFSSGTAYIYGVS